MKQITYFSILALLLCNGCLGCKNEDCTGTLLFDLPVQAYGVKDTLQIGDTLRIRFDIPDQLPERNSGIMYDFIDYNFKLITYMVKIDSLPVTAQSADTFEWITQKGTSKYLGDVFIVNPLYENQSYQYEVLILPKKKGLYVFGMNSDFSRASPLASLDGPCSKNQVQVAMKLINETNVNFEFLQNSPEPTQAKIDRQRFDDFAGFCFYVQ